MDICVILKWLIKYLYFIDYNLNKENKQKMTTHIKHPESLEMLTLSRVKANIYEGLVSASHGTAMMRSLTSALSKIISNKYFFFTPFHIL